VEKRRITVSALDIHTTKKLVFFADDTRSTVSRNANSENKTVQEISFTASSSAANVRQNHRVHDFRKNEFRQLRQTNPDAIIRRLKTKE
jgi:hypothetical protein